MHDIMNQSSHDHFMYNIVAANYLEPRFEKISKKNRKWHGVLSANLEPENQNDGVLSSHLEPLSTRYLEPPPCFLFCHFVFTRVFQHFFIYMPKIQKGYLLQTQPYPW